MSEPPFGSLAIAGLGLIGGSIARAAREQWPSCRITGIDDPAVVRRALAAGVLDAGPVAFSQLEAVELIVLAAPVFQNIELLKELGSAVRFPVVVTDVGGTKRAIVEAARALPAHLAFVGGHPLGGSERTGFDAARADLFKGRPWILTPEQKGSWDPVMRLSKFVAGLGSTVVVQDPALHDRVMALVSHLPQLTASALMDVVGRAPDTPLSLAGQGLVDTTRLASSASSVWRDICLSNADAIGEALDQLIDRLQAVRAGLERGETIDGLFDEAGRWRAELMKGRE